MARSEGSVDAVISERCRSAAKVTVSVCGEPCSVLAVNPWLGTAEIRQTPPLPKRTVALPPWAEMVCTPEPPSWQPPPEGAAGGFVDGGGAVVRATGVGVGGGGGAAVVRAGAGEVVRGLGLGFGEGDGEADGDGEGEGAADGDAGKGPGADWATGAVGRVDPTTKWTVSMTAVTLAAVQDSQINT